MTVDVRTDAHLTMPWPRWPLPIGEPDLSTATLKRAIASPSELEITVERVFNASPDLVFRMWLEPKYLTQWWGPKGFTSRLYTLDPRPGGKLHIVLCAPDGTRYPMQAMFREIVVAERLVLANLTQTQVDSPTVDGTTTVIFTERDHNTELTVHTVGSALYRAAILEGTEASWKQSLDRLDEVVARAGFLPPRCAAVYEAARSTV
jgi:uncharacterized protein YndB with AHSA1/START domain